MKTKEELLAENKHDFDSLVSVMSALRGEGGCPWDIEQTHKSVRKCLIEETYEVVEAIDKEDSALLREELGDLMFQAVFHAQIEDEENRFDIYDVVHDVTRKMITRHPHVFATTKVSSSDEVLVNWDNIKKEEKQIASPADALKRVPPYLPALMRAQKIQGKAKNKYGYGIKSEEDAVKIVATSFGGNSSFNDEDLKNGLFALCALAEMKGIDLEALLSHRTDAFISEFENKGGQDSLA